MTKFTIFMGWIPTINLYVWFMKLRYEYEPKRPIRSWPNGWHRWSSLDYKQRQRKLSPRTKKIVAIAIILNTWLNIRTCKYRYAVVWFWRRLHVDDLGLLGRIGECFFENTWSSLGQYVYWIVCRHDANTWNWYGFVICLFIS
jgi:hypothetical protein